MTPLWVFTNSGISWESNTARHRQSRRFLQYTEDNFLMQVMEEPMRRGALLDIVFTNKEGLVGDVKAGSRLGCSNQKVVEFRILHRRTKTISRIERIESLYIMRANFVLLKDLHGAILWARALEGKGIQESWLTFKHHFL